MFPAIGDSISFVYMSPYSKSTRVDIGIAHTEPFLSSPLDTHPFSVHVRESRLEFVLFLFVVVVVHDRDPLRDFLHAVDREQLDQLGVRLPRKQPLVFRDKVVLVQVGFQENLVHGQRNVLLNVLHQRLERRQSLVHGVVHGARQLLVAHLQLHLLFQQRRVDLLDGANAALHGGGELFAADLAVLARVDRLKQALRFLCHGALGHEVHAQCKLVQLQVRFRARAADLETRKDGPYQSYDGVLGGLEWRHEPA